MSLFVFTVFFHFPLLALTFYFRIFLFPTLFLLWNCVFHFCLYTLPRYFVFVFYFWHTFTFIFDILTFFEVKDENSEKTEDDQTGHILLCDLDWLHQSSNSFCCSPPDQTKSRSTKTWATEYYLDTLTIRHTDLSRMSRLWFLLSTVEMLLPTWPLYLGLIAPEQKPERQEMFLYRLTFHSENYTSRACRGPGFSVRLLSR